MGNGEKKICIIISNIDRWIPFEWIHSFLEKKNYLQSYILLTDKKDTYFYRFLTQKKCPVRHIRFRGKKHYFPTFSKIIFYLKTTKPDIVHCHFIDASVLGLSAAFLTNVPKRIYTRHHSFFHHDYFPKGVWLDKLCNRLSTDIIAISNIVKKALLKEGIKVEKINIVHHGFKLEEFESVDEKRINKLIEKYNLNKKTPVIGVIARFIEWKGIQYIIPAFRKFLTHYPEALLILANARGSFYQEIVDQLKRNIPKDNYILIPFERDIQALFHLFDLYVHVPINQHIEAFGQTYVEALAAGVPSIFTKSGIANDFVEQEKNALLIPFKNSSAIYQALLKLMEEENLRTKMIKSGKEDVKTLFTFELMMERMLKVYQQ